MSDIIFVPVAESYGAGRSDWGATARTTKLVAEKTLMVQFSTDSHNGKVDSTSALTSTQGSIPAIPDTFSHSYTGEEDSAVAF